MTSACSGQIANHDLERVSLFDSLRRLVYRIDEQDAAWRRPGGAHERVQLLCDGAAGKYLVDMFRDVFDARIFLARHTSVSAQADISRSSCDASECRRGRSLELPISRQKRKAQA
jgi:hypothetical protein